jgi:hypothetical protein
MASKRVMFFSYEVSEMNFLLHLIFTSILLQQVMVAQKALQARQFPRVDSKTDCQVEETHRSGCPQKETAQKDSHSDGKGIRKSGPT